MGWFVFAKVPLLYIEAIYNRSITQGTIQLSVLSLIIILVMALGFIHYYETDSAVKRRIKHISVAIVLFILSVTYHFIFCIFF